MSFNSIHYEFMKAKYGNDDPLLFTDRDSLIYEVKTEAIYEEMVDRIELFDLSNFQTTNPYYIPDFQRNKAKVGLMKDEAGGDGMI